jgi:hypothetical protein
MKLVTIPTVTIDHWIARRYTAGDVIERWSIVNADGRTILTYDNEIEPRETCKGYGWVVGGVTDSGWITDDHQAAEAPDRREGTT